MADAFSDCSKLLPADAAEAAQLIRTAFAALTATVDPPPSALQVTTLEIEAALRSGGGAGTRRRSLAGVVLWHEEAGRLHVRRLAVAPEWRGRGIARILLAAADQAARDLGLPFLELETRLALSGNRALFAACGYVETSRHAHPGHAAPTYVRLEKKLA